MNVIGIDRWLEEMKKERQIEADAKRTREKEIGLNQKDKGKNNTEGNVVGGWRECFLKVCQWVFR